MMPVATKVILTLIVNCAMFGGLFYVINHMRKNPDEWFFFLKKDFWTQKDESENN